MALWYFLKTENGEMKSVAAAKVDRFFCGEDCLPATKDNAVQYVLLLMKADSSKKIIGVSSAWYEKIKVLENGELDREYWNSLGRLAADVIESAIFLAPGSENVIPAAHRFAARREEKEYRWVPSKEDVENLRSSVNKRARAEIM